MGLVGLNAYDPPCCLQKLPSTLPVASLKRRCRTMLSKRSAIFAFMAARAFPSIEEAQNVLCPSYEIYSPEPEGLAVYEELFRIFRRLYFGLGSKKSDPVSLGEVLPQLRAIASKARGAAAP